MVILHITFDDAQTQTVFWLHATTKNQQLHPTIKNQHAKVNFWLSVHVSLSVQHLISIEEHSLEPHGPLQEEGLQLFSPSSCLYLVSTMKL